MHCLSISQNPRDQQNRLDIQSHIMLFVLRYKRDMMYVCALLQDWFLYIDYKAWLWCKICHMFSAGHHTDVSNCESTFTSCPSNNWSILDRHPQPTTSHWSIKDRPALIRHAVRQKNHVRLIQCQAQSMRTAVMPPIKPITTPSACVVSCIHVCTSRDVGTPNHMSLKACRSLCLNTTATGAKQCSYVYMYNLTPMSPLRLRHF